MRDFRVKDHSSIFIITPLTPDAKDWVGDNILTDEVTWDGAGGVVVEHRYIDDILDGIKNDGLTVKKKRRRTGSY